MEELTQAARVPAGIAASARLRIERDLRDPALSPSRIAARLRMAPRHLRAIFSAGDETVSAYILRRRLEECARELADPERRRASITEIAFGWGFDSAPHFTRSFRERFGMSPRQYRACAGSLGLLASSGRVPAAERSRDATAMLEPALAE